MQEKTDLPEYFTTRDRYYGVGYPRGIVEQELKNYIQENKTDINEQSQNGHTVLHSVIYMMYDRAHDINIDIGITHQLKNFKMLLDLGANPCIRDNSGLTPVDYFIELMPETDHGSLKVIECISSMINALSDNNLYSGQINLLLEHCVKNFLNQFLKDNKVDIEVLPKDSLIFLNNRLDNSDLNVLAFKKKINAMLDLLNEYPDLPFVIMRLIKTQSEERAIVFRALLLNEPNYPFFSQIGLILDGELLAEQEKLLGELQQFINEYENQRQVLVTLKATLSPLTEEEKKTCHYLYKMLDAAVQPQSNKVRQSRFNELAQVSPQDFMINRYSEYQDQDKEKRQKIVVELEKHCEAIKKNRFFGEEGVLAKLKQREQCQKAAERRRDDYKIG